MYAPEVGGTYMSKRAVFVRVRGSLVPAFLGLVAAAARSNDFDATRNTPARGGLGADLFGVVCDRMGGQSLHEDLSGGSFRVLCHGENGDGVFGDASMHVDEAASHHGGSTEPRRHHRLGGSEKCEPELRHRSPRTARARSRD